MAAFDADCPNDMRMPPSFRVGVWTPATHHHARAFLVQLCHMQHTNKHKHITSSWVCPLPTLLLCTKAILSYTTTTTSTS